MNVTKIVNEVLKENKETRANDDLLFIAVLAKIAEKVGVKDPCEMKVKDFFTRGLDVFPSFDSVTRRRRECQKLNPKLRPSKKVIDARKKKEEEIRKKYSKIN